MDIQYRREQNETWLILPPEAEEDGFAARMMVEVKPEHLLQLRLSMMDGAREYCFEVSGGSSLTRLKAKDSVSFADLKLLFNGLAAALDEIGDCLMETSHLYLDPALIFSFRETGEIRFCFHPALETDLFVQVRQLMQYCLNKLDHQDKKAVEAAYEMFEVCHQDYYRFEELLAILGKTAGGRGEGAGQGREELYGEEDFQGFREEAGRDHEDLSGEYSKRAEEYEEGADSSIRAGAGTGAGGSAGTGAGGSAGTGARDNTYRYRRQTMSGLKENNICGEELPLHGFLPLLATSLPAAALLIFSAASKIRYGYVDWRLLLAPAVLMVTGIAMTISGRRQKRKAVYTEPEPVEAIYQEDRPGSHLVEREVPAEAIYQEERPGSHLAEREVPAEARCPEKKSQRLGEQRETESSPESGRKEAGFFCGDSSFAAAGTQILDPGATTILGRSPWQEEEVSCLLIPLEDKALSEISLRAKVTIIGYDSASADGVIDAKTVSRRHAEFEKREGGRFYLKDLGSTNGTFLNEKRLEAEVWHEAKEGDKIAFADVVYVLTKSVD